MPPVRKIQKEEIIQVAYNIVKEEGMEGINARKIAKNLNCSIQPIFHNFSTMEELKNKVIEKIYATYSEYMKKGAMQENPYRGMGVAYIRFAKECPNFFKILFMSDTKLTTDDYITVDSVGKETIENGQKLTGLEKEEQKRFHMKVWIFTHGLATMVATNTCHFSDEEITNLLSSSVSEMLKGYRLNKGDQK